MVEEQGEKEKEVRAACAYRSPSHPIEAQTSLQRRSDTHLAQALLEVLWDSRSSGIPVSTAIGAAGMGSYVRRWTRGKLSIFHEISHFTHDPYCFIFIVLKLWFLGGGWGGVAYEATAGAVAGAATIRAIPGECEAGQGIRYPSDTDLTPI